MILCFYLTAGAFLLSMLGLILAVAFCKDSSLADRAGVIVILSFWGLVVSVIVYAVWVVSGTGGIG